jgi:FkbM family methyltransferase
MQWKQIDWQRSKQNSQDKAERQFMNAVVTISIGDKYNELGKLTHPSLKTYADKIGAEFIVIDQPSEHPHWEKFQLYNLLLKYQRIIYLDTDMIVRDDCPSLFEMVPDNQLGIFNEGRFDNRFGSLKEAYDSYHVPFPKKWDGTYYNTGVMVISRRHRQLFKMPERIISLGMYEQGYLNMKIQEMDNDHAHEVRVFELDYKFNRMQLADTYCGIHRCDSYIVHYAGAPPQVDVLRLIREDLHNWWAHSKGHKEEDKYKYEREIVFYMGGGMGDQLAAEPVVRFTMEHMFKDVKTNYVIVTNWTRFFTHLNVPCVERTIYEAHPRYDTPVKVLKTIPAPDESSLWQHWSHISGHTTDYAAISTIHRILPDENRDIHLSASIEGLCEIMDIAGGQKPDMVLVHPGRGWDSKTFPANWWEAVIKGLIAEGKTVGIIGQQINDEQGYVKIEVPEGAIDFRDILSLDGLIALIATSNTLISNDSVPVHIAGAFDNNIILIATCRHSDYILPYRKGSKGYKSFAFKKKLTIDEWDLSPTMIFKESADVVKGNILDYLPTPEEVVAKAIEMTGVVKEKTIEDQIDAIYDQKVEQDKSGAWNENYEPEVAEFFRKNIKAGDNVIDVGANIGLFTSLASQLVGNGKVYAFEPEKNNFKMLLSNTNGNVEAMNVAVGDKNKEVDLYFNLDGATGHSLWNPANFDFNQNTRKNKSIKEKVKMVTLDTVIDCIPKLIKTDTEGCELMVLKGAKEILEKYKPLVVCELNQIAMKEMGTNKEELGKYMKVLGYKSYTLPEEEEIDLDTFSPPFLNCNIVFKGV